MAGSSGRSPPGSTKSGLSKMLGLSSISRDGIHRALTGRVTKPRNTEVSERTTKSIHVIKNAENTKVKAGHKDVRDIPLFNTTISMERPDKINTEENDSQERSQEDEEDEDSKESIFSQPSATMARYPQIGGVVNDDIGAEVSLDAAWRIEQIYLNTILNARNEHTLMPSTWKMHFRGIPLPDSLFYVKRKRMSIRPRIYARTERLEYRGALALRKLIDVHGRIQDIRDKEASLKVDEKVDSTEKKQLIRTLSADITKQLRRALEQALEWAKQDGGIDNYGEQLPPNARIMELKVTTATDIPESEEKIQTEMCSLAAEWGISVSSGYLSVQAPVLFGFVIMKHIVTIVTLDPSDPDAVIHVPCQLHMAERNQHQWNALAILVTVCWARDVLLKYIAAQPDILPEVKAESSDPDA